MCTSPMRIYYTGLKTDSGADLLVFDKRYPCPDMITLERAEKFLRRRIPYNPDLMKCYCNHLYLVKSREIPCGHCDQCRISNAKKWAYRIMMEIGNSQDCIFLTLTFADEFLPENVSRKDITMFMKRLRKYTEQDGIRFFACGEYGTEKGRPHYHLIIWNIKLDDLQTDFVPGSFVSPIIAKCWPYGRHNIEPVTIRSVAYVARYTAKKYDAERGFVQMSTRPGIGRDYLLSHTDALHLDYYPLLVDGVLQRLTPPRYAERIMPGVDWKSRKDDRVLNAERARRLDEWLHGCRGEKFDAYMRRLYEAKASKLAKKGIE